MSRSFCAIARAGALGAAVLTTLVLGESSALAELTDDEKVEAAHLGTRVIEGAAGVPIAYTHAGQVGKQGIVFVHSILASSINWEQQIRSDLAEDFNLVAMDMRGHGASGKPWTSEQYVDPTLWAGDIEAVVADAQIKKPVLVAWSYGGLYAMDYIRTFGADSVSGLVLVGSKAGFETPAPATEPDLTRRLQVARNTSPNISVIHDWTAGYMNFLVEDGPNASQEKARFLAASLMTPHYVRPFFRMRPTDNRDLMSGLDIPLAFWVGENDAVNKAEDIEAIAEQFANADVQVFEDTAGMPFWYQSEAFNAALRAFISRLPSNP